MFIKKLRITIIPEVYGQENKIGLDVDVETEGNPPFKVRQTLPRDDFISVFGSMMEVAKARIIRELKEK